MRFAVFALLAAVSVSGCDGKPLTGPDAQHAVAEAQSSRVTLDTGLVIMVDGVRVPSQDALQKLDPRMIESVEIVKGRGAEFGSRPERMQGLILIKTKRSAAAK